MPNEGIGDSQAIQPSPMKTQYYTASSLDGFIAIEEHSLEWLVQLGDINDSGYPEFIKEVEALVMGSRWLKVVQAVHTYIIY